MSIRNQSGFSAEGRFYKGNLHCHSTQSDGRGTPEERVAEYKEAGYDFLAITDHWFYTNQPELGDNSFLVLPGTELDCPPYGDEALCYHIVGIGRPGDELLPTGPIPHTGNARVTDLLELLERHGNFAFIAHPHWSGMTTASCATLPAVGMEVYNGLCHYDFGTGFAEQHINEAVYAGGCPLLFATDDYHHAAFRDVPDHFSGYVMVKAPELTHQTITEALLTGQFYASYEGPEITRYEIVDNTVVVETSPCRQICLRSPHTVGGTRVSYTDELTRAEFPLQGNEESVRVVVLDKYGHASWTQLLPVIPE